MFRRGLAYFILVFSLLFAQQGGFAHELSHLSPASQQDKQLPHTACDQCGAYSQVGAGAISQAVSFASPEPGGTTYARRNVVHSARHRHSHLPRAPPSAPDLGHTQPGVAASRWVSIRF